MKILCAISVMLCVRCDALSASERPFTLAADPPPIANFQSPRPRFGEEGQGEGASAPNDSPTPANRCTQWLMFTADWCPACQSARADFEPWLRRGGWRIDDSPAAHIRVIDGDRQPDLVREWNVSAFPTFLLMQNGRELYRQQGYPGRSDLVRRYTAAVETTHPPAGAISIGTVTGQRDHIAQLIASLRPLLGDGGTLTVQLDRTGDSSLRLPLGERLSIRSETPLVMRYSLNNDILTCRFAEPLPRGRFTFRVPIEQSISAISMSISEVIFELPRAPDVRLRIEE